VDSEVQGRTDGRDEEGRDRRVDGHPRLGVFIVDTLVKAALIGFFYLIFSAIRIQLGI
jgi:hypothetical protein